MSKQEYTVDQAYEDMIAGLEIGIDDLTKKLNNDILDLTKSELERALLSIINYPDSSKVYHEKEVAFSKNLQALHGLHLQAEIQALGELQQENENERKED